MVNLLGSYRSTVPESVFIGLGALCLVLCLMVFVPWTSALTLSADEPYEWSKATLLSQGWTLYDPVWSDQPPIHTWLLSRTIGIFEEPVIGARLLAFGFSGLLLFGMGSLIAMHHGRWAGCIGMLLLTTAPHVLELLASATLMVPVMSTGVLSLLAFSKYQRTQSSIYLILSGACLGIALQIKLTAFIFIAPMLVQYARLTKSLTIKQFVSASSCWVISMLIVYGIPFLLFTEMKPKHLLNIHFSDFYGTALQGLPFFEWRPSNFLNHPEVLFGGVLCCLLLQQRHTFQHLWTPILWLCALMVIHSVHKPYWWYYSLHFTLPLCWISAAGWGRCCELFAATQHERGHWRSWHQTAILTLWIATCSLLLERSVEALNKMRALPRFDNSPAINHLKNHREKIAFVQTNQPELAFHAGVPMVPELAVVSKKRLLHAGFHLRDLNGMEPQAQIEPVILYLPLNRMVHGLDEFVSIQENFANKPFILCYTNERDITWIQVKRSHQ